MLAFHPIWWEESGAEAADLASEHAPDVILMDLMMPGMDGVEATRQVKRVSPRAQVILLTSYHQDEHIVPAIQVVPASSQETSAEESSTSDDGSSTDLCRWTRQPISNHVSWDCSSRAPLQDKQRTPRKMSILLEFWPFIVGGLGILWGVIQSYLAGNAKKKAAQLEGIADAEKKRADKAEQIQEVLIKSEKEADKNVQEAVEKAKSTRRHFQ